MSDKFVASNGVELDEHGEWMNNLGYPSSSAEDHDARKEFYQHLRDTELGRWRWADDPRYLVFALKDDDEVRVLDENSGQSVAIRRSSFRPGLTHTHFVGAALAYFDAHPVSKPWADAEADEVWMFESVSGLRLGQLALAWRGKDMLWDVIDPKGSLIDRVEDPLAALIEHGYESFEQLNKASRYAEVVSDDS